MAKRLSVLPEPWSEGYYPNTQAVRHHWWPSESLEPIGSRTYLGSISIFSCTIAKFSLSRTVAGQFRAVADPPVVDHFHAVADPFLKNLLLMVVTRTGAKIMEEALAAIQAKLQELDDKFLSFHLEHSAMNTSRQSESSSTNAFSSSSNFRGSKLDFLHFNDTDPTGWIYRT